MRSHWFFGLLACAFAQQAVVRGQSAPRRFDHLSIEQGLSNSIVHHIFRDRNGFLWFCTQNGLNRYDGHQFRVFRANDQSPGLLRADVRAVFEDRKGLLWIVFNNGGVQTFDPATETFTPFLKQAGRANPLSDAVVTGWLVDRQGTVWLGTEQGLNRCDPVSRHVRCYKTRPGQRVTTLREDSRGTLWVGTTTGLCRVDPASTGLCRFRLHRAVPTHRYPRLSPARSPTGAGICGWAPGRVYSVRRGP